MSDSIKNLYEFQITSKILQSDGATDTFTISNDLLTDTVVSLTNASILLENRKGTRKELIKGDASGGTFTIDSRGIKPDGTTSTSLQYERPKGTEAKVVVLEDQIFDKTANETISGDLTYTGDTTYNGDVTISGVSVRIDATGAKLGFGFPNLTTAERIALSAVNGDVVYDTTIGELYQYIGGAWSAVSAGSTQPNGSETVAGKYELSTAAERGTATSTGATGARLVVANDGLVKTSSGAGDENKVPVLDSNGKLAFGFMSGDTIYANGNSGTALTIDWDNGNIQTVTLNDACTFTFTAPTAGTNNLRLIVDGSTSGGYAMTFPGTVIGLDNLVFSALNGAKLIIELLYDGTNYYATTYYQNNNLVTSGIIVADTHTGSGTSADISALDVQYGDIILVAVIDSTDVLPGDGNISVDTSGFTQIAYNVGADDNDCAVATWYKVVNGEPDTTLALSAPNTPYYAIYILRGVNMSTPQDATVTTYSSSNTTLIDPASITTVTDGALVVVVGCHSVNLGNSAPSGYTNYVGIGSGTAISVHIASKIVTTAGAEDPGAFGTGGAVASDSACAQTLAFRPNS